MPTTPLGIRYPASTSSVNIPGDMGNLASDADTLLTLLVNPPRFHVTQVALAQSMPNATWTSVTYNTEVYDTANGHDNVTNPSRYTVQAGHAGLWLFGAKMSWDNNTTGRRLARYRVNGATVIPGSEQSVASVTIAGLVGCYTVPYMMAAGDYVEMQQNQDSGSTLPTFTGDAFSGGAFWGIRISS